MPHGTKIATCCYCGSRTALVLRGEDRHELSCGACGAPLHDMKMLRADAVRASDSVSDVGVVRPKSSKKKKGVTPLEVWERKAKGKKKKKSKRKTFAKKFFEEAFDVLEDIFD